MMFGWWQLASQAITPFDQCEPQVAAKLVELKLAKRCLRGLAIQILAPRERERRKWPRITQNGPSNRMGPQVIEGSAMGIPHYVAIVAGWAGLEKGAASGIVQCEA